jgi:prepilin-type processing-associated H-X9-DG protein
MYASDNTDFMPWPNWGSKFQGWLYTPVNGLPPDPSDPPETVYAGGTLWPYLKVVKVYWCPMDYTNTAYFPQRLERLSSYIMNGGIMGYHRRPTLSKTHKLADMNPAGYTTWEASDNPPYDPAQVFNDGASFPREDEGPSERHGSGCNVSSFDGHAQFLKFETFQDEQTAQPGPLWCDPDSPKGDGVGCALW